ncbi:MAG TPA: SDR family oxidoreductase [Dehalococcoidia bacterium]|nr:SDR family oxidoreductase [Dehalococcoidia bacterium]
MRKRADSVVVVTGASSGIGRATALAFARERATVVLAARRAQALAEVAGQCDSLGGRALVVPTDVTEPLAVEDLARRAVESFGRIDVWVNNAAVTVFGRFEETPPEAYRRVIETNLFGYIHGARAVLPTFRDQGSGVLINVGSMVAKLPQPYTSAYVISKHGVRALGMSLRQELLLAGAKDIHVCTVLPATIDTPFFQHAANFTGRGVKAMPPVYPAEQVARTIVGLATRPRREVFVGRAGRMLNLQQMLAPGMTEGLLARLVHDQHLDQNRPAEPTLGNLFEPDSQWTGVGGGWKPAGKGAGRTVALGLAAAVPGVLAWFWLRPRTRRLPALNGRRPAGFRIPAKFPPV